MQLKGKWRRFLQVFVVLAVLLIWGLPLLWLVVSSIMPSDVFYATKFSLNFRPSLEHYSAVLNKPYYLGSVFNSLVVATIGTIVAVSIGSLAAYGVARYQVGGRLYTLGILGLKMVPPMVLSIPFYVIFAKMGLINTRSALIIVGAAFNLPFVMWLIRGFIVDIPKELDEAAYIDGASRLKVMLLTLRLVVPGIVTAAIFCFIFLWNEFIFASILAFSPAAKTMPVALGDFITAYSIQWGPMLAASAMVVLPVAVLTLSLQRNIISGLTYGAVKG